MAASGDSARCLDDGALADHDDTSGVTVVVAFRTVVGAATFVAVTLARALPAAEFVGRDTAERPSLDRTPSTHACLGILSDQVAAELLLLVILHSDLVLDSHQRGLVYLLADVGHRPGCPSYWLLEFAGAADAGDELVLPTWHDLYVLLGHLWSQLGSPVGSCTKGSNAKNPPFH